MKKLLGSALALALVFPAGPVSAELLKNLKTSGGIDVQMAATRNVTDFSTHRESDNTAPLNNNDRIGAAATRVWASLMFDLLDDVHAKVTLRKNDRAWGTVGAGGQGAGGNQALMGGAQVGDVASNVYLNEAWFKIDKLMGHFDTTVGRQFWGESGDLIAFWGPKNTWGLFVTAIDAFSVQASNDWMNFQGIAGKTAGQGIGGVAAVADIDVRGIDIAWKGLPVKANTFLWNRVQHGVGALGIFAGAAGTNTGLNDNLWLAGIKLKGEAMGGWVSLTAAANAGQNRAQDAGGPVCVAAANSANCLARSANYQGRALLLDAGYKLDVADIAAFTPWLNFGWGTGRKNSFENKNEDFQSISSDYRPGVIYGRFNPSGAVRLGENINDAGSFAGFDGTVGVSNPGLTNRQIWGVGLKANPAAWNKLTAGVSFWDFNYQRATVASPAGPTSVGNRHIGSEIDVQLDWAHSENVTLSGGVAQFRPGGFIKEAIRAKSPAVQEGVNPVSMVFADLSVRWGN